MSTPRSVFYEIFVAFKGAFPSISHHLLWHKLNSLGVSSKILNILIDFYAASFTSIKTEDGFTDKVKISCGVLQGDVLSPLLFLLVISDMEIYFFSKRLQETRD